MSHLRPCLPPSVRELLLGGLALGFSLLLCASPAPAVVHEVEVIPFEFVPRDLTVAAGDTVRWIWVMGTHTVTHGANCTEEPNSLFDVFSDPTHPVFEYQFNDPGTVPYFCRPHCLFVDMQGTVVVQGASDVPTVGGGSGIALAPPAPNPSRAGTMVRYELADSRPIELTVHDGAGRRIRTLSGASGARGVHWVEWDGKDDEGRETPSGIYWVRLNAGEVSTSRSVVCLR